MQHGARPARPFTHFANSFLIFLAPPASCQLCNDIDRSGVSLATISLTTNAPMQRGARPACPFTHFCEEIYLLLSWPCSCGWRSSRCCSGASLASISHTFSALVFHWLLFR